jgi:hypothetical protein
MYIIQYFDWMGTREELEEQTKLREKVCAEIDGVKYMGRKAPHNDKYHFAHFYEANDYNTFLNVFREMAKHGERDYKKEVHTEMKIFSP